jgi:hypothetical protein
VQQSPLQFVLDHNFPYQVVHGLDWPPYLRLRGLKDVAPDLIDEPDDWRILLQLATRGDVDGYITNDAAMLELPEEMVALTRTRLTLVVTVGVGHNPVRATGLLMTYLPEVARRTRNQSPRRPTIYRLSAAQLGQFQVSPSQRLDKLAERQNVQPQRLISDTRRKLDLE